MFSCETCGATFRTQNQLARHLATHIDDSSSGSDFEQQYQEEQMNELRNMQNDERKRQQDQQGQGVKKNRWIEHVKQVQNKYGLSYKDAMKKAKETYN